MAIEATDIQGVVLRGYGRLPQTAFVLLEINRAAEARKWLSGLLPLVTPATESPDKFACNIAFSSKGLSALGLSDANVANFSIPFREGMAMPNRQRLLGDFGESDPKGWRWGGQGPQPHILLILNAPTRNPLNEWIETHVQPACRAKYLRMLFQYDAYNPPDNKEHFGFHDSISQPVIKGSGRSGPENDIVATGEFLLGYENEHNRYPFSPLITEGQGDLNLLPPDANGSGYKDLGRNGTFLVYRMMEQDVEGFWNFMREKTRREDGKTDEAAAVKLASRMIGRWPDGAPLVKFPDQDPKLNSFDNDFGYASDPNGYACPFGAHLRRNNPRDNFRTLGPEASLKLTRRHRIMRRGRMYGEPNTEKGLHFIGLNADIEQQFEFIQHVWSNNNQLSWLYNDPDPIIGVPDPHDPVYKPGQFTIQQPPVSRRVEGLQRFVTIRAGEYFFLPGIMALRYLCTLGE